MQNNPFYYCVTCVCVCVLSCWCCLKLSKLLSLEEISMNTKREGDEEGIHVDGKVLK